MNFLSAQNFVRNCSDRKVTLSEKAKSVYLKEREKYERDQRLRKFFKWSGSAYQPNRIVPGDTLRERLVPSYTAEKRKIRAKFLQDVQLPHDEPRYVPELRPRNIFRRLGSWPWDVAFNGIRLITGVGPGTSMARRYLPRFSVALGFIYWVLYHNTYHYHNWEALGGWGFYHGARPQYFPGDDVYGELEPNKPLSDFGDFEYKQRKALRDYNLTSFNNHVDRYPLPYFESGDDYEYLNKK